MLKMADYINTINVSEEDLKNLNLFTGKKNFEKSIYNLIKSKQQGPLKTTVLIFPKSLTTEDRHIFHTYTQSGIIPTSHGKANERYMEIEFSHNYITKLFEYYQENQIEVVIGGIKQTFPSIEPEIVEETEIDSEKTIDDNDLKDFIEFKKRIISEFRQNLYDDLMAIINKYF